MQGSSKSRAQLERRLQRKQSRRPKTAEEEVLPVWAERVQGGRLVKTLQQYVEKLRDENPHGNRSLFLDDVFVAYLLAFFNPSIRSLRVIEDFSQTVQGQRHLTTQRICKSTLSDFNKIADPERLDPIIAELRKNLDLKSAGSLQNENLDSLLQQVLAVDGTFFSAAADVAWAVGHRNQHVQRYRARVDVSVDIHTWLPEVIAIPEPGEGEAHRAAQSVKRDAIHIYDRGFGSFDLLLAHYEEEQPSELRPIAQFVLRAKSNQLNFTATQERPLTDEQRRQGIVSDRAGFLDGLQRMMIREVVIQTKDGEEIRLLTNLFDVSAEVVGQLYQMRWQIELFFRWLKCYANFNHLISHHREGVLLNFYVVIIGAMLMYLHTEGRPSKYALILLGMVAQSGESLESILPILRERERQCEVARKSAAARRARKKAESR